MTAAVVLDLSANGIAVARSLGSKGITVYALDTPAKLAVGSTKYAICRPCPDPYLAPDDLLQLLLNLARQLGDKPVLFGLSDDFVEFISLHRDQLAEAYRFLLPPHPIIQKLQDKRETYCLAMAHGIPTPKTWRIHEDDSLWNTAWELPYPCLLKPARSARFRRKINRKAVTVKTPKEMVAAYRRLRHAGPLMIQELIPGGDDQIYQIGLMMDEQGRPWGRFMGRKLLQYPPHFGSGALVVAETNPTVLELANKAAAALGLYGLFNLEFKRDPRDGSFKLMEIDPRLWLWHGLSEPAGIDLAYVYYSYLVQRPISRLQQRDGIKWVHEVRALSSAWHYYRSGYYSVPQLYSYFQGRKHLALFRWDDPMPLVKTAVNHFLRGRR